MVDFAESARISKRAKGFMYAPNFKPWPNKSTQVNANLQNHNLRGSFASHYANSGALLINYSTAGIARDTRKKRAPECPRGFQREKRKRKERKTKTTAGNIFIKTYFVHILAWETCD